MTHAGAFKQVQGTQDSRDLFFPPGGLTWGERLRVPGLCSLEHSLNLNLPTKAKRNTDGNSVMRSSDMTFTVKRWLRGSRATSRGSCDLLYPGWVSQVTQY